MEMINKQSLGNTAKLREVVKCLMENLNIHLMQPSELITVNRAELDGMVRVCEKALAAPARNCDVYATVEKARKVWCGKPSRDWDYLCDWLYATNDTNQLYSN